MKKVLFGVLILGTAAAFFAFCYPTPLKTSTAQAPSADKITWHTWDEAVVLNKENPKKLFVDLYTDWCGWCKKMDAETFTDPAVIEYMNANYYAVKFNAEQKEDVVFDGRTFKYVPSGNRGYHELAAALLQGKMSYPSFAYLDGDFSLITVSPGYKDPKAMLPELKFIGEKLFEKMDYQTFLSQEKSGQ